MLVDNLFVSASAALLLLSCGSRDELVGDASWDGFPNDVYTDFTDIEDDSFVNDTIHTTDETTDYIHDPVIERIEDIICSELFCEEPLRTALNGRCGSGSDCDDIILSNPSSHSIHVVGLYRCEDGEVSIHIGCVYRRVILVLSAYDPCTWNINVTDSDTVEEVVVHGALPQIVISEEDLTISTIDGYYGTIDEYALPVTQTFIESLELTTGYEVTTYQGCHSGESFEISHYCE